jgi:hypothetical protein
VQEQCDFCVGWSIAKRTMTNQDQSLQETILRELRFLRSSFETHKAQTSQRLSRLETQVSLLVGNDPEPILVTASPRRSTRRPSWRLVQLKDSTVLCQNERRFVGAPVSRLKFKKVGFVLGSCRGQVAASTDSVNRAVRVYAVMKLGGTHVSRD